MGKIFIRQLLKTIQLNINNEIASQEKARTKTLPLP